jgi:hypothetical protein
MWAAFGFNYVTAVILTVSSRRDSSQMMVFCDKSLLSLYIDVFSEDIEKF